MSQLPEFEFGVNVFCVLRSASVRSLHLEFDSTIGVASSAPSTVNGAAEVVSGVKSVNLVLTANRDRLDQKARANAIFTRFDMIPPWRNGAGLGGYLARATSLWPHRKKDWNTCTESFVQLRK